MTPEEHLKLAKLDLCKAIEIVEKQIGREFTEIERAFFSEGFKHGGISGSQRAYQSIREEFFKDAKS